MKKIVQMALLSMLISFVFTACERTRTYAPDETEEEAAIVPVEEVVEEKEPATVQEALRDDAKLARKMNLAQFSEHMRGRQEYYARFNDVHYNDGFVKIDWIDGALEIETAEGIINLKHAAPEPSATL
ncbi:hypothetical protein [Pontibacter ruber]|uniref:PepSY domain-containing protein n=1 Tax=Pontibacter ruber TaxID=1343895 RepID=A0ABW5D191_9BACT|nr:hypothetical protein [Pontibacter ruber]